MKRTLLILSLVGLALAQSTINGPVPQPGAVAVGRGPNFVLGRAARVNFSGQIDTVDGSLSNCVHVDGGSAPCATGTGGSSPVTSVFARTGDVAAAFADYSFAQIAGSLAYSQIMGSGANEGDGMCFHSGAWGPGNCSGSVGGGGTVSGVFGRSGNVVAANGDYLFSQIGGTLDPAKIAQGQATLGQVLGWNGLAYAPQAYAGPQFSDSEAPAGTLDGVNLQFTLQHAPNPPASLILMRNGVLMTAGVDYLLSGGTVAFFPTSGPRAGDGLVCWYRF